MESIFRFGFFVLHQTGAAYARDYILKKFGENHGNISRIAEGPRP